MQHPARALLLTDEPALAEFIELALPRDTYLTRRAVDVEDAHAALHVWQPHLTVIDLDSIDLDMMDRLGHLTQGTRFRPPIIAITRRSDLEMKLAAFERGVDDILTVPFSAKELGARSMAIMRRTYPEGVLVTPVLRLGELEIDVLNRRVRVRGEDPHLTSREQNLLYLLAANAGRVLTRDEILDRIWGVDYVAESNVVDRHIRNLRAKLQDDWRQPRYIATVSGQGYRFILTVGGDLR